MKQLRPYETQEDQIVDVSVPLRKGKKIIMRRRDREGPGRDRSEGRKGVQDQVWEEMEKYRRSGN